MNGRFAAARLMFAVLAFAILTCSMRPDPKRPAGVPENAIWIGGPDGGVFAVVTATSRHEVFHLAVYHDSTGDILYRGPARLEPDKGPAPNVADPNTFSGWDGSKMILSDGRTLVPVKH